MPLSPASAPPGAAPSAGAAGGDDVLWLDPQQQRAWRAYLVGTTLLMERLDRELGEAFDLSLSEYEILVRLSEAPENRMRMAVLASSLSHSRSRLTHTVKRMEQRGLVVRSTCSDDGRGVEATLTEEGRSLLAAAAPLHVRGVRRLLVDLVGPEDFSAVGRAFEQVSDALVAAHPDADIR